MRCFMPIVLFCIVSQTVVLVESFVPNNLFHPRTISPRTSWLQAQKDDENETLQDESPTDDASSPSKIEAQPNAPLEEQLNDFLDKEFFNPSEVPESSPLRWFADLVQNDYALAEALYASFFIAGMVLISQELVRMQIYGDQYVPFHKLGNSLF